MWLPICFAVVAVISCFNSAYQQSAGLRPTYGLNGSVELICAIGMLVSALTVQNRARSRRQNRPVADLVLSDMAAGLKEYRNGSGIWLSLGRALCYPLYFRWDVGVVPDEVVYAYVPQAVDPSPNIGTLLSLSPSRPAAPEIPSVAVSVVETKRRYNSELLYTELFGGEESIKAESIEELRARGNILISDPIMNRLLPFTEHGIAGRPGSVRLLYDLLAGALDEVVICFSKVTGSEAERLRDTYGIQLETRHNIRDIFAATVSTEAWNIAHSLQMQEESNRRTTLTSRQHIRLERLFASNPNALPPHPMVAPAISLLNFGLDPRMAPDRSLTPSEFVPYASMTQWVVATGDEFSALLFGIGKQTVKKARTKWELVVDRALRRLDRARRLVN